MCYCCSLYFLLCFLLFLIFSLQKSFFSFFLFQIYVYIFFLLLNKCSICAVLRYIIQLIGLFLYLFLFLPRANFSLSLARSFFFRCMDFLVDVFFRLAWYFVFSFLSGFFTYNVSCANTLFFFLCGMEWVCQCMALDSARYLFNIQISFDVLMDVSVSACKCVRLLFFLFKFKCIFCFRFVALFLSCFLCSVYLSLLLCECEACTCIV